MSIVASARQASHTYNSIYTFENSRLLVLMHHGIFPHVSCELIDKFRNFLISSNYFVTSRPEYQFGHRPHNRLLKTFFYKCRVMFASCVAIQTLKTIVFLFIASPNHAREGNDGLKRSILPVSPLKTTIVFVADTSQIQMQVETHN